MVELTKPKLVIRIGFAGSRVVADGEGLAGRLSTVFTHIADVLATSAAISSNFYAPAAPVLRLTTGLAEGGDLIAAKCFRVATTADQSAVVRQSAAVLPFSRDTFRLSLNAASQPLFDEEINACGKHVVELDGRYLAGDSPPMGKTARFCSYARTRAYRGQATFLLRRCDLLLAVYDPSAVPKPAGTVETIRNALELGIPVVIIPFGSEVNSDDVAIVRHNVDFHEHHPTLTPTWREILAGLLEQIIVPPPVRAAAKPQAHSSSAHEMDNSIAFVHDYFADSRGSNWLAGVRQKQWAWFEGYFKKPPDPGGVELASVSTATTVANPPPSSSVIATEAIEQYRSRAAELARHFNGVYRGTFFVNYGLSVIAILLAVFGLRLLLTGEWHGKEWVLFALALAKLAILTAIFLTTEEANHKDFNGKGIDYRYLAERLRAQPFLAMAGSGRPPTPAIIRHATRADRLVVVEWLFQAVIRQEEVSALALPIDPESCLFALKSRWLDVQTRHHEENSVKMERMHHFTEKWAKQLGLAVIVLVVLDLAVISFRLCGWMPEALLMPADIVLTSLLVPLTALLPAAVASLNGVRFQSECDRLAERSKVMASLLSERSTAAQSLIDKLKQARKHPNDDEGGWATECLLFAESCARIMADEVADWSVLYSKTYSMCKAAESGKSDRSLLEAPDLP